MLVGVSSLSARTWNSRTVIWGISARRELFTLSCDVGNETTKSAWSVPVPILTRVKSFSFYLNTNFVNNTPFAYLDLCNLVQLSEDSMTKGWTKQNILLPSTAADDIIEFQSFTTRIAVTQDDGTAAAGIPTSVTSAASTSLYLNSVYQKFDARSNCHCVIGSGWIHYSDAGNEFTRSHCTQNHC